MFVKTGLLRWVVSLVAVYKLAQTGLISPYHLLTFDYFPEHFGGPLNFNVMQH